MGAASLTDRMVFIGTLHHMTVSDRHGVYRYCTGDDWLV